MNPDLVLTDIMAGKGKREVSSARNLLDATLQCLVDKKEEGEFQAEAEMSLPLPEFRSTLSPKKFAMKPNRKRKRKDDSGDYENYDEHQTVIMKLFDRSVDLAQFSEDSSLYPVCRAWIHNRPHDKSLGTLTSRPATPDPAIKEEEDQPPNVYTLPPPIKSEDGILYDLRVPEPVAPCQDSLDIHASPESAPPAENLLLNHMTRWKDVRNRWHQASLVNEMQYSASVNILKDMFEQTMAAAECQ